MRILDAEGAEVEAKSASDWAACDIGESSLADTADMAWELGQEPADNDTIEVHAAAENDVTKARVGTGADSRGRFEGGGQIAPVAHRPCRADVVHCEAERPAAPETAYDDERSSPLKGPQCHPSMRAAPTPGWLNWERCSEEHGGREKKPSASEAESRGIRKQMTKARRESA